jgi:FKBP-type peptidyl-prolyl cis-trans isomerase FkpA
MALGFATIDVSPAFDDTMQSVRHVLFAACLATFAATSPAQTPPSAPVASAPLTTASGMGYRVIKEGSGAQPTASDTVKVHYRGTFPDGKEFDSSFKRGEPIEFPLNRVIKCWTEGVQLMKVGGKAQLTCPAAIAYGERGAGGVIPPNATLLFEVELLGITPR